MRKHNEAEVRDFTVSPSTIERGRKDSRIFQLLLDTSMDACGLSNDKDDRKWQMQQFKSYTDPVLSTLRKDSHTSAPSNEIQQIPYSSSGLKSEPPTAKSLPPDINGTN